MIGTGSDIVVSAELPLQWPLVGRHTELDLFVAALDDPRAHGFVIHGPAGVGKTRLADQCLALASRAGRNVARATASEGARTVPLGALAHLLPPNIAGDRFDLVALMSAVKPMLQEQETSGPLVLFVDDLHLLDISSATLVGQLVDGGLVFLVATVRANVAVPADLDSLWHRARVRRVDLDDLDRTGVDTLLHLVLRGPVEASTISDLWAASQGNVLFLRELVLGAIDSGSLALHRQVWRLVGPLVSTTRLNELVAARLSRLGPEAIGALDILAVWEPIGLAVLESIVVREELETLERFGLLTVTADRRRQHVRLAHPLYGEILRARMPVLTRRRLLLEQIERITSCGARRREDPIRIAAASLEATGSADPALLVRAARLARYGHDFTQVELFARAALADGMTAEIGLLLGEALHEVGTYEEADAVLSAAAAVATDEDLLVYITEIQTRNLMWGMWRNQEAIDVNGAVCSRVAGAAAREELALNQAMLLTYGGRPREALAALEPLGMPSTPRARALRAFAELTALIAVGRCEAAVEGAQRAYGEQIALPEQIAIPFPGIHIVTQIYGLAECGRLAEATALATLAYEQTPASAPPDGLMWFAFQLGRCALLAGQVETARRWLAEALARCEAHQIRGPSCLVLSLLATAHACAGDADSAAVAVAELDRLEPFAFVRPEQDLGRAWALAAAGDLPRARLQLMTAVGLAADAGYVASEAMLLHDVVRLGGAASVVHRLQELGLGCEGLWVPTFAAHAAAVVAGKSKWLVDVADQFESFGAKLLAAEAANEAAQAYQDEGNGRAAAAMRVRSDVLAEKCEGARTPGLSAAVMIVPLTARERDIAALASSGESSKEIADRLFLSVRTVNNHLQNVYSKLGIAGRHQLEGALGDD